MTDDHNQPGGIDEDPVERRSAPRAPMGALVAEVLRRDSWTPVVVCELSVESLFVEGEGTEGVGVGATLGLRLSHEDQQVQGEAVCSRQEEQPRNGLVLTLPLGEDQARALIGRVLEPSRVPPGVD